MDFGWANVKNGLRRSRAKQRADNNLGTLLLGQRDEGKYRDPKLEKYDAYYENRQYDHLVEWDQACDSNGVHIPVRKRKPRIKFAFAKTLASRLTAKLVGQSVFPSFRIEESPDDQEFFAAIIRESKLKSALLEPIRRMVNTGSVFVRFYISAGVFKLKYYHSKYCYVTLQDNGELQSVRVQYVYPDMQDKKSDGSPKMKWYRMDLGMESEILYDNPEYVPGEIPQFQVVSQVDHDLGFVQGEWFSTTGEGDGYGVVCDITDFIDEINYSLSQSSQAVSYNQDPQLTIKNMDEHEMAELIRSSTKSWNLGKAGEAGFLESNLNGVQRAIEMRDRVQQNIQDIARVLLLDPEKIVGSAQSGKAMEVLYGPMKDLIDELREPVGDTIKKLVLKMGIATVMASRQGIDVPLMLPPGYMLQSINLIVEWPPIFQQTIEDLQKKVQVAVSASSGNIISRKTATAYIAKDFGIEDIEAEHAEIAAQPVFNPFGSF